MEDNQLLPPQVSALAVRPLLPNLDLNPDRAEGLDATIAFSSGSDHFDINELIISHGKASVITGFTEANAVDDDDGGVGGALLAIYSPLHNQEDQHLDNRLLPAEVCTGSVKLVYGVCINDGLLTNGGVIDAKPGVAQTGGDKNSLAINPDQSIGPGRYDQRPGLSIAVQGPHTEEANDAQLNAGSSLLNASWKNPNESAFEAQKVIQSTEGLDVLPKLATSGHLPGVKKSPQPESSAAARDNLMPVKHFCATEGRLSPTESHWEALSLSCVSKSARETQVHEFDGAIHRLMPPDRIIGFDVDEDSFARGSVRNEVTKRIISAAEGIAQIIESRDLGIKFDYRPDWASNVFTICYDPNLGPTTLARAFFPSDSQTIWQLRISSSVAFSTHGESGYLDYIPNILAHEFAHILGLRHWNAAFHPDELDEPSVLWPDTIERNRFSVMDTEVHPRQLRFSEEDFRVIREIYSLRNGDFCAGRKIVDVNPYTESFCHT